MKKAEKSIFWLSIVVALAKGVSVFYFVLLPVFYAEGLIDSKTLGYLGALAISMVIFGAVVVARWLHSMSTKRLLSLSAWALIASTVTLFSASYLNNIPLLVLAYAAMGVASGAALSGINVLIANNTVSGDRYKAMAQLTMMTDVVRIIFPLFVAGAVALGESSTAVGLILIACVAFLLILNRLPKAEKSDEKKSEEITATKLDKAFHNKPFRFVMSLEFLDSFSSSQLFVFVPLVFLAKGYSLQNTLVLQSFIFIGYLSGRWIVSMAARKYSGFKAIAIAEVGMVAVIVLILLAKSMESLYILSFALGVFTRGTSPAIKALAFDALPDHQVKQGSAFHVIAGDSGSALAQFTFGLLVAWYGVNAPFIVAAVVGGYIALVCAMKIFKKDSSGKIS